MIEIWKDIEGYEGFYQVSNIGNIKSLLSGRKGRSGRFLGRGDMLLRQVIFNGYYHVILYKDRKPKNFNVHRLVGFAFIDNPENKPNINHKDGNRLNNNIENLEWCTQSENQLHAYRTGLQGRIKKRIKPK